MYKKNNSKEKLIEYLLANTGKPVSREAVIQDTGISKSRLSELINDIRSDGYTITTPNRSGMVLLESAKAVNNNITPRDVRQWLIILTLSKLQAATYIELICGILSIIDSIYLYDKFVTDCKYSDMDILKYLDRHNINTKQDIDQYLPLPTLRKDLHALIREGYIEMNRTKYNNSIHVTYSLSEKAPTVLFESEDELYGFMAFYDAFKSPLSNSGPLEALYKKASMIFEWTSYDSSTQIYGKSNKISKEQLICLESFAKHPYKTKTLEIKYLINDKEMETTISAGLLFYSVETNSFYLLCINMENMTTMSIRLDRITSISEGNSQNHEYRSSSILHIYEEMFSSAFEPEKIHVKVLFEDFGNISERLKALHHNRKFSKLYTISPISDEIPHTLVYEDELRGMYDFARYLRSFGSSALVLEPSLLQSVMIQSNQKILNNYGENPNEYN